MEPRRAFRAIAIVRLSVIVLAAAPVASSGCSGDFRPPQDGSRGNEFVANPAGGISLIEEPLSRPDLRPVPGAGMYDAPTDPQATLYVRDGECEVWVHPGPFWCEVGCSQGNCVGTDECAPYPRPLPAGNITMSGLVEPLRFVAGDYGYTADRVLGSGDVFADDAAIVATAADGEVPGFTLRATGVVPLEADFPDGVVVDDGVDEVIRWRAAQSGRIQLLLVVGHHVSFYETVLVCETDDDGELVVPGALITHFPRSVTSESFQHPSWLTRFSRDVVDTEAGPVQLFVGSRIMLSFHHR